MCFALTESLTYITHRNSESSFPPIGQFPVYEENLAGIDYGNLKDSALIRSFVFVSLKFSGGSFFITSIVFIDFVLRTALLTQVPSGLSSSLYIYIPEAWARRVHKSLDFLRGKSKSVSRLIGNYFVMSQFSCTPLGLAFSII